MGSPGCIWRASRAMFWASSPDGTVIRLDSLGLELSLAEVFAGLFTGDR